MAQTAEGSLGQVTGLLTRMRELAVQSANGSQSSADRGYLDTEFGQLKSEIDRIQKSTKYDGNSLIKAATSATTFQVGINNSTNDQITVTFGGLTLDHPARSDHGVSGATSANALDAIDRIDAALTTVSTTRARFGAVMNRFDVTTANIQTARFNLSAANSRIRDVDVAEESAALSRSQVLSQAAASVLAQANQSPQLALGLAPRLSAGARTVASVRSTVPAASVPPARICEWFLGTCNHSPDGSSVLCPQYRWQVMEVGNRRRRARSGLVNASSGNAQSCSNSAAAATAPRRPTLSAWARHSMRLQSAADAISSAQWHHQLHGDLEQAARWWRAPMATRSPRRLLSQRHLARQGAADVFSNLRIQLHGAGQAGTLALQVGTGTAINLTIDARPTRSTLSPPRSSNAGLRCLCVGLLRRRGLPSPGARSRYGGSQRCHLHRDRHVSRPQWRRKPAHRRQDRSEATDASTHHRRFQVKRPTNQITGDRCKASPWR